MRTILAIIFLASAALPAAAQTTSIPKEQGIKPELVTSSARNLGRPHDVVLSPNGRYLLVADLGNDVIRILEPETLKDIGQFGRGELSGPHDVTFDRRGRVLVADTANDRIAVFSFDGIDLNGKASAKLVEEWTDGVDWPEGVAAGAGGRIYVGNVGNADVIALENGKMVGRIEWAGKGNVRFQRPHDVHVSPDGRVLVADSGNNRVVVLDADLKFLRELTEAEYQFHEPKYLATPKDGLLFVADEYSSQIKILDRQYRPVGFIGTGEKGDGPGQLNWPEGVEVVGNKIWVSDTYNNRILLFRR